MQQIINLTKTERKMYERVVEGLSNKEIALDLGVTEINVKKISKQIYDKVLGEHYETGNPRFKLIVNHYKKGVIYA